MHGFKLINKRFIREVNADCYYFKHDKSGARLFKIAADDPNKTFAIAFKTLPDSDTGIPHILEHSVLNGSKKFPVKSPFDILHKGSLNTFLNAMTWDEYTIYPVASMNETDYFNLIHVYLDAVFNPLIYDEPRIFRQEGWHYEITEPGGPLTYKGIVYNEMKGVFSDPEQEADYWICKHLFPDTCYRFDSGGHPDAIPMLTEKVFLDFHHKYYHPSNACIFLYGNASLNKELQFISDNYLNMYDHAESNIQIPIQKPFNKIKEVAVPYSVTEDAEITDQTYLTLSWVAGSNGDRPLTFILDVLTDVLVNHESAPVRLALQEAELGKDVEASLYENLQNVFSIHIRNANPKDRTRILEIIIKTLRETIARGLDKETVEGIINRIEFYLREGDDAQKGITYGMRAMRSWMFADDPFLNLEYELPLQCVKNALLSGTLESMIQTYLIQNNHALLLIQKPTPGLEKQIHAATEQQLQDYKAALTDSDIQRLITQSRELIDYQNQEDSSEALATIPLLTLQDIDPVAEWTELNQMQIGETLLLHHAAFTNQVSYITLYFDAKVLPQPLIPYAALLSELLGNLDTENYSFGDLENALNIHTGDFHTRLSTYLANHDDSNLLPKFMISSKAMPDKINRMFDLLREIINRTDFNNLVRLEEQLARHQARLNARVKRNGLGIARTRLTSYFSQYGKFEELARGLDYYWFITDLHRSFHQKSGELRNRLIHTAKLLFSKSNLMISVTCEDKYLPLINKCITQLTDSFDNIIWPKQEWDFVLTPANEGLLSASKVQYVVQGYDFKKLGYAWNGNIHVLNKILSSDWLWNQIHIIGGAYGGFCGFSINGLAYFASYRDPNLNATLESFARTPDYLKTFNADKNEMTRFIIGAIAGLDKPLTASQQGSRATARFISGRTKIQIQKDRDDVLQTAVRDIQYFQNMIADVLAQNAICVYGNEEKLISSKDLFGNLISLK